MTKKAHTKAYLVDIHLRILSFSTFQSHNTLFISITTFASETAHLYMHNAFPCPNIVEGMVMLELCKGFSTCACMCGQSTSHADNYKTVSCLFFNVFPSLFPHGMIYFKQNICWNYRRPGEVGNVLGP